MFQILPKHPTFDCLHEAESRVATVIPQTFFKAFIFNEKNSQKLAVLVKKKKHVCLTGTARFFFFSPAISEVSLTEEKRTTLLGCNIVFCVLKTMGVFF